MSKKLKLTVWVLEKNKRWFFGGEKRTSFKACDIGVQGKKLSSLSLSIDFESSDDFDNVLGQIDELKNFLRIAKHCFDKKEG